MCQKNALSFGKSKFMQFSVCGQPFKSRLDVILISEYYSKLIGTHSFFVPSFADELEEEIAFLTVHIISKFMQNKVNSIINYI